MSVPEKVLAYIFNKSNELKKSYPVQGTLGWPWNESFSIEKSGGENISHILP
jgi:hypothetical protein